MNWKALLHSLRSQNKPNGRGRRGQFQPRLEQLEERVTPTTLPNNFFSEATIASGIGSTTAMAVAPDGRVFVTTQSGDVRVIDNGTLQATPFFHFADIDPNGERGALGVAFDPNFATNHFVYIYHTVAAANGNAPHNEVSRFTANGDVAAAGSQVDILKLNDLSSATNHNGGAMHFGTDNKLYIDVGENANPANAQTLGNLLGKVLRIDVSQIQAGDPVNDEAKLIPSDNPFTPGHASVASGINQTIYALGFRNPFTFGVDPVTGTIFIDDVGQNTWEEIDKLVAGGNYGWNTTEGFATGTPTLPGPGTYQDPLMSYNHNNASPTTITGIAIVGGVFYEPPVGATNPFPSSFNGKYFFSDLAGGFNHDHSQNLGSWIRVFDPANPGSLANPDTSQDFAKGAQGSIVNIVMAPDGGLYYLARSNGGEVMKISFAGTVQAPTITQQPASQTVTQGGSATFTVSASGAGTLGYQWQRDNGSGGSFVNITGATSTSFTVSNVQATDNNAHFRVIVSNTGGSVTSNPATLTVTANNAPTGSITVGSGLRNGNFDAGTPISFTLAATDQEDGTEPASRFTYQVDYVTSLNSTPGGVVRPFVPATSGVASASFTPATTGPYTLTDVLYRITFTVTDANGLASTVVRDIAPNTVTLTEQTNPTGLQLSVDGQSQTAPTSFGSVVGFVRVLNAPTTEALNGTTYTFVSWSDGGAAQHNVTTPTTNATFTATYNATVASAIRMEAESLTLNKYVVESGNSSASGGKLISLKNGGPTPQTGTASGTFSGPSGLYLLDVGYYDENDGVSTLSLTLGGQQVDSWQLSANLPSGSPDAVSHTTRRVGVVNLTNGEAILLTGTSNQSEYARWDYLNFTPVSPVAEINAGGAAVGAYAADTDFTGGGIGTTAHAIDLTGVADAAPQAVYQSWRNDAPTYVIPKLVANQSYEVRLHFAEDVATASGQRVQNVTINGKQVLTNFDIFAQVGAFKALVKEFTATADALGNITIGFATVAGTSRISGIEIVDPLAAPAQGTGLSATFFNNTDFTGTTVTRVDPTISWDWGTGSPDSAIAPDTFSARWTGKIQAPVSGTYTFFTTSDDGVRLWINGQLIIDQWNDHAATVHSGTISMAAGQAYDIQLEYYENGGLAVMKLEWENTGGGLARQIVPRERLFTL